MITAEAIPLPISKEKNMSKRVDLTEKLDFEGTPVIIVKGVEIEVNDDAQNVLKLMGMAAEGGDVNTEMLEKMANMLFTEQGKKNLDSLKLNMASYTKVIETAMDLATGEYNDDDQSPQTASTILQMTGN